jgi:hypothetical protein
MPSHQPKATIRFSALDSLIPRNPDLPRTLQKLAEEYKKTVAWSASLPPALRS